MPINKKVTRGFGFLENFLAVKRAKISDQNIPDNLRNGIILDIGCGNYPYFLNKINFSKKIGIDQHVNQSEGNNIKLIEQNLAENTNLPFDDNSFNVVTALAFLEHVRVDKAVEIIKEIYRVLRPNGLFIATTPHCNFDLLLRFFSKIKLVSAVEIKEHVQLYNKTEILKQLKYAGFKEDNIKIEKFELGANIFAIASKK